MFTDSLCEAQHDRREVKGGKIRKGLVIRRKDSMAVLKVVLQGFVL